MAADRPVEAALLGFAGDGVLEAADIFDRVLDGSLQVGGQRPVRQAEPAAHVADPLVVDGVDVRIGCSIGFTLASGHERAAELIAEAEQAMAGAKRAGKGRSMSVSQLRAGPGSAAQSSPIDWNELAVERPDPEPEGDPIPGLPAPTEGLAEELLPNLDLDHNRHDKARFDTEDSANR